MTGSTPPVSPTGSATEAVIGRPGQPTGSAVSDWHVGRSWTGNRLERDCPCPKQPCGLVAMDEADPDCPQHAFWAAKTDSPVPLGRELPAPGGRFPVTLYRKTRQGKRPAGALTPEPTDAQRLANPAAYCQGGGATCETCVGSCGIEEYEQRAGTGLDLG